MWLLLHAVAVRVKLTRIVVGAFGITVDSMQRVGSCWCSSGAVIGCHGIFSMILVRRTVVVARFLLTSTCISTTTGNTVVVVIIVVGRFAYNGRIQGQGHRIVGGDGLQRTTSFQRVLSWIGSCLKEKSWSQHLLLFGLFSIGYGVRFTTAVAPKLIGQFGSCGGLWPSICCQCFGLSAFASTGRTRSRRCSFKTSTVTG